MQRAISRSLDTPWKMSNGLRRWLAWPWIRLVFLICGVRWGRGWRIYGAPVLQRHRDSQMRIGSNLGLRSWRSSNPLGPNHPVILCTWQPGAVLQIGDDFGMTGGSIVAAERITIGDRVTVGANCTIIDTDFHPLDPALRRIHPQEARTAPIIIEDDVFIGMNCLVLKGVTIGAGSVVAAGSVVTRNVPAHSVVAGNPIQVIRTLG